MVKHNHTIRQLLLTNCLSVFEHFVGLALKGLNLNMYSSRGIRSVFKKLFQYTNLRTILGFTLIFFFA